MFLWSWDPGTEFIECRWAVQTRACVFRSKQLQISAMYQNLIHQLGTRSIICLTWASADRVFFSKVVTVRNVGDRSSVVQRVFAVRNHFPSSTFTQKHSMSLRYFLKMQVMLTTLETCFSVCSSRKVRLPEWEGEWWWWRARVRLKYTTTYA